mmetsp:Transcript_42936/g.134109  ORF Transcript_42936/g.134109 Transcript_42936/m.134109 type:complete len:332 (-) Transcript_42936:136-1131(-)
MRRVAPSSSLASSLWHFGRFTISESSADLRAIVRTGPSEAPFLGVLMRARVSSPRSSITSDRGGAGGRFSAGFVGTLDAGALAVGGHLPMGAGGVQAEVAGPTRAGRGADLVRVLEAPCWKDSSNLARALTAPVSSSFAGDGLHGETLPRTSRTTRRGSATLTERRWCAGDCCPGSSRRWPGLNLEAGTVRACCGVGGAFGAPFGAETLRPRFSSAGPVTMMPEPRRPGEMLGPLRDRWTNSGMSAAVAATFRTSSPSTGPRPQLSRIPLWCWTCTAGGVCSSGACGCGCGRVLRVCGRGEASAASSALLPFGHDAASAVVGVPPPRRHCS